MTKKSIGLYLIFGVLATVVYFVTRFSVNAVTTSALLAVVAGQVAAILFAFVTNKFFVFKDKATDIHSLLKQFVSFCMGRGVVFFMDLAITYFAVEKYASFFIQLFGLRHIDYQHAIFSNAFTKLYIGSPELLNTFLFALLSQVLSIVLNFIISKWFVFKDQKQVVTIELDSDRDIVD